MRRYLYLDREAGVLLFVLAFVYSMNIVAVQIFIVFMQIFIEMHETLQFVSGLP